MKPRTYDDGSGPALYVGGCFTHAGGTGAINVARWDGEQWSALGAGLGATPSQRVNALFVHDNGSGPSLYAGGTFVASGGVLVNRVARWTGTDWVPLGSGVAGGINPRVLGMATYDDGSGPALYVGGEFTTAGGGGASRIAKWNGQTWSPLGTGLGGANALVEALTVFDAGKGPELFVGGAFESAGGQPTSNIARWNGLTWSPVHAVGGNVGQIIRSLAALTQVDPPLLIATGVMTDVHDQCELPVNGIVAWNACVSPSLTPGDLNGDGIVNVADLLILLGEWGPCLNCDACIADLTGNCAVGVADLLILLGNWG